MTITTHPPVRATLARATALGKTTLDLWSYSPAGAWRILTGIVRWIANPAAFRDLREQNLLPSRHQREAQALLTGAAGRGCITAVAAPILAVLGIGLLLAVPRFAQWPIILLVAAGLGWVGTRPRPGQAQDAAPTLPQEGALLADVLTRCVPGMAQKLKDHPRDLKISTETRDGPGHRRTVTLPVGVTVDQAAKATTAIAGGLGVSADMLHIVEGDHPGQAIIWQAGMPLHKMPPVPWPLAGADRFSLTDPLPIGATPQDRPVRISLRTQTPEGLTLAGGSLLIGGVSGSGKTTLIRLLAAAAALDPRATICLFDGKGDGDYRALEPAADWVGSINDPDAMDDLRDMLAAAQGHMRARQQGRQAKTPLVIVVDEVQVLAGNKPILGLIEDLVRRGRSAGIVVILATQRPTADSIPTAVRDNVTHRIALRSRDQVTNDAILGTGAYSSGKNTTLFRSEEKGAAYVDCDGFEGRARLAVVSDDTAGRIARQHPRQPGVMFPQEALAAPGPTVPPAEPSQAATAAPSAWPEYPGPGLAPDPDPEPAETATTVLDHILSVWLDDRDRAATTELLGRLMSLGEPYTGWTPADLTRALKGHGVTNSPVRISLNGVSVQQRGYKLADVQAAAQGAPEGV